MKRQTFSILIANFNRLNEKKDAEKQTTKSLGMLIRLSSHELSYRSLKSSKQDSLEIGNLIRSPES